MDLFGQSILDFPSEDETLFLGQLRRVSESEYLGELGIENFADCINVTGYNEESNDSALGSSNGSGSDASSEVRSQADLGILQDEDSYLDTAVSFDQVFRSIKTDFEDSSSKSLLENLSFEEMISEESASSLSRETGFTESGIVCGPIKEETNSVPDVENVQSTPPLSFENILGDSGSLSSLPIKMQTNMESLSSDIADTATDFNLFGDLEIEHQEVKEESDSSAFDDLLKSMFDASEETDEKTDYDDLLTSILSSEENIDPEYFENFANIDEFDIDSVDPACIQEKFKEESDLVEVKKEPEDFYIDYNALVMRDHDYTLPITSSLFLTPPHSPGEDSEADACPKLVKESQPHNLIVKFNQPKDLKFVINLPVKKDAKRDNSRSILKRKVLNRERDGTVASKHSKDTLPEKRSARELVREILEKRSLTRQIEEKREFVKSMKRRRREETLEEQLECRGLKSKYRCLENVEIKSDNKKYRKFEEERELHNSMERQRRIEMKEAYDYLKGVIPPIASKEKVSKLNILNTARDYCHGLGGKLERLEAIQRREAFRQRQLLEQLKMLQ